MKQTVYQLITVHVQSALVGFAFYSKISHVAEECFNYAQTYTFRGGGGGILAHVPILRGLSTSCQLKDENAL